MTARSMQLIRTNSNVWRMAAGVLLLAAVIVGLAITIGGTAARVLNGIGALLWLASGVLLATSLPAPARKVAGWLAAIASGLVLGAFVRPSGIVDTVVWFAAAGAVVTLIAGDRSGGWALLAPAVYLPVHLLIGIGRAIVRNGAVRTEPPPTAALVPLAMVAAAAVAGALIATFMRRERPD